MNNTVETSNPGVDISFEYALELLRECREGNTLIMIHAQPDGDAVGSGFALRDGLRALYPSADIELLCADIVPKRLSFLCGEDEAAAIAELPESFRPDRVISVDTAAPHLLGSAGERFPDVWLRLDHHATGTPFARNNHCNPELGSCGELIYSILKALGALTIPIGEKLYAAISSDTGCFKYRSVSADTHRIAAELFELGIDHTAVDSALYDSRSLSELEVLRCALNNLTFCCGGRAAYILFTNELKEAHGLAENELGSVNSLPRGIEGVDIGVVIKQKSDEPEKFRISMRSGENADVSAICAKFGGGGHIRAAGAEVIAPSAQEAATLVMNAVRDYLKESYHD